LEELWVSGTARYRHSVKLKNVALRDHGGVLGILHCGYETNHGRSSPLLADPTSIILLKFLCYVDNVRQTFKIRCLSQLQVGS